MRAAGGKRVLRGARWKGAGLAVLLGVGVLWSGTPRAGGAEPAAPVAAGEEEARPWPRAAEENFRYLLARLARARRSSFERRLLREREELARVMELSEDAQNALDAPFKVAATASTVEWMRGCEKALRAVLSRHPDEALPMIERWSKEPVIPGGGETDYTPPEEREEWKAAVQQALTPERQAAWERIRGERKARRVRVTGEVMIDELDRRIGFTAKQREELEPLVERVVKIAPLFNPEERLREYANYSPRTYLALTAQVSEQELAPVLDAVQRERWKKLREAAREEDQRSARTNWRGVPIATALPRRSAAHPADAEEVENELAEALDDLSGQTRQRWLKQIFLRVEEASRLSALAPETVERLKTAARGATEACLAQWKVKTELQIRGELATQSLEIARQWLPQALTDTPAERQPLWQGALQTELTQAQRSTWKMDLEARTAYRNKVATGVVLTEFDEQMLLTPAQWSALEARVGAIVTQYGPDLAQCYHGDSPWYLDAYCRFLPVVAIPEEELATILAKEQSERWRKCVEHGNAPIAWNAIEKMHASRMEGER